MLSDIFPRNRIDYISCCQTEPNIFIVPFSWPHANLDFFATPGCITNFRRYLIDSNSTPNRVSYNNRAEERQREGSVPQRGSKLIETSSPHSFGIKKVLHWLQVISFGIAITLKSAKLLMLVSFLLDCELLLGGLILHYPWIQGLYTINESRIPERHSKQHQGRWSTIMIAYPHGEVIKDCLKSYEM